MNKILKLIICGGLCGTLLLGAAGCKPGKGGGLSETRTLNMATGALDGNFNPFFYTAQNDGNIASMTQVAMFTVDVNGDLAYGENYPTVALDYKETLYDANGNDITAQGAGDVNGTTEYEIIIKNGIKFSDGVELTIKDVLFNMYVLLDPAYTGSSTLYSVDIVGLQNYRRDELTLSGSNNDIDNGFRSDASTRIDNLIEWGSGRLNEFDSHDVETVNSLFKEEVNSDWVSIETSWEESFKEYNFTEAWQAYLFNEGIVKYQTRLTGAGAKERVKVNDKYLTTLDPCVAGADQGTEGEVVAQSYIDAVRAATTDAKVKEYLSKPENEGATEEYAKLMLQREYCTETVYTNLAYDFENNSNKGGIATILTEWATATTALDKFTAEERTKYFENSGNKVKYVKGITTDKTSVDFSGKNIGQHDVLKVRINGVDPKAKWNLSFTVSPLHYYSGKFKGENDAEEIDYVATADGKYDSGNFGVRKGNDKFFSEVLSAPAKNGLPVGAGAYQASNQQGETGNKTDRTKFFRNNVVYFCRNDYFETLGSGIENAKIKFAVYKVMSDAKIMDALKAKEIDIGTPTATGPNLNEVTAAAHLSSVDYTSLGYGYVGINPKYVPQLEIRQAIMKAIDTTSAVNYFGSSRLAQRIYRPMSTESFVYQYAPINVPDSEYKREYSKIAFDRTDDYREIKKLVSDAGYTLVNGKYQNSNGETLKYKFSIAGESKDHPAYNMLQDAADNLNSIGFDITVQTEIQALKLLATGGLEVWAAAWTSTVDPDMYQVYHRDSKASSVKNWGYDVILNNQGKYPREFNTIKRLSDLIDDGRHSLDKQIRSGIYAQCLDLVMDLAVELPTYQRSDLAVYNNTVIKASSLPERATCYVGLFDKLWELDYV